MILSAPAIRYSSSEGPWKDKAIQLTNTLVNIRAIINHFSPKVDSWAATRHLSSLTEEQVQCVTSCFPFCFVFEFGRYL